MNSSAGQSDESGVSSTSAATKKVGSGLNAGAKEWKPNANAKDFTPSFASASPLTDATAPVAGSANRGHPVAPNLVRALSVHPTLSHSPNSSPSSM